MKHSHLVGNLPRHLSGPNRGKLHRAEAAQFLGISGLALHKGYNNWCQIFRMPHSSLTLEQYFTKLSEAGITVFDLGNRLGCYNLARYNDEGPYTNESCRFVRVEQNLGEQLKTPIFDKMIAKNGYQAAIEHNRRAGSLSWTKKRRKST